MKNILNLRESQLFSVFADRQFLLGKSGAVSIPLASLVRCAAGWKISRLEREESS